MTPHVKRSERGWRVGESHQNAVAPDAVVCRARDLHEFERLGLTAIVARLAVEFQLRVSPRTVEHWIYYTSRNVTPREMEERVPTHRTLR